MKKNTIFFLLITTILLNSTNLSCFEESNENIKNSAEYIKIANELRCPTCANQSIINSDSEIAISMKNKIIAMLRENKNEEEIINYFLQSYGSSISYAPKLTLQTLALWFISISITITTIIAFYKIIKS